MVANVSVSDALRFEAMKPMLCMRTRTFDGFLFCRSASKLVKHRNRRFFGNLVVRARSWGTRKWTVVTIN